MAGAAIPPNAEASETRVAVLTASAEEVVLEAETELQSIEEDAGEEVTAAWTRAVEDGASTQTVEVTMAHVLSVAPPRLAAAVV